MSDAQKIADLEYIIEQLRDENRIISGAPTELQATRERDALRIIADIAAGTAEHGESPVTVANLRAEFAAWVERFTAQPKTSRPQMMAVLAALDAVDDIISGRMRRLP